MGEINFAMPACHGVKTRTVRQQIGVRRVELRNDKRHSANATCILCARGRCPSRHRTYIEDQRSLTQKVFVNTMRPDVEQTSIFLLTLMEFFMQKQEIAFDLSIDSLEIEELKMSDFVTDSAEGESVSKVMSASCTTCVCTCSCIIL